MGKRECMAEAETYEHQVEPIGKRFGRFVTLMGLLFAVGGGVVVTQRLSKDALALLVGLSCGVSAMLPTVLLGGLWLKRELGQRERVQLGMMQIGPAQQAAQPQVIVVTPQALPGYDQAYNQVFTQGNLGGYRQDSVPSRAEWPQVASHREFKVVGGMD